MRLLWRDVLQIAIASTILCQTVVQARNVLSRSFSHDNNRHKSPKKYAKFVGPIFPPNVQLNSYLDQQNQNQDRYYDPPPPPPPPAYLKTNYRRQDSGESKDAADNMSGEKSSKEEKSRYPRPDYSHYGPFFHDMKKNEPEFHRQLWFKVNKLKYKKGTEHKVQFARALEGYTRWVDKGFPHRGYLDYTYVPFVPKKKMTFERKKPGKLQGDNLVIG